MVLWELKTRYLLLSNNCRFYNTIKHDWNNKTQTLYWEIKEQYLLSGAKFGGYGSFFPTQKKSTNKVNVNVKKVKTKSNFTKS